MKKTSLIPCLCFFLMGIYQARSQTLIDMHAGPYFSYLSSSSFKSSSNLGFEFGGHSQAKINHSLGFMADYYVYYSSFKVTGSNYTPGDSTLAPANIATNFADLGFNYSIALQYFIVPPRFSILAGAGVAFDELFALPSPTPDDPSGSLALINPSALVSGLTGSRFDYGARFGICYKFRALQVSLGYFKGFKNMSTIPGIDANMSRMMLQLHFSLTEMTIAKACQNRLIK